MSFHIAVASGKGGTGKTTVASNLFRYLSRKGNTRVVLVDCDVEEPNAVLFFPGAKESGHSVVNQEIPVIDSSKCIFCRKCADYCEFNAIVVIPPVKFAEVNPSLCHSCGACLVACESDAIRVKEKEVGMVRKYETDNGTSIVEGILSIGSPMQTMVIRSLKRLIGKDHDIVILDAPPGTSCPVVETVSDADYVVLVSEPTPFGLHDLHLMVRLVREIKKPFGVIINKAGLGNQEIYEYLEKENINLLGEIPFSKIYASQYAGGQLFKNTPVEIEEAYHDVLDKITDRMTAR